MYIYWKGNLRVADLQTPKMAERRPEYLQSNKITGKNRFLMVDEKKQLQAIGYPDTDFRISILVRN